MSGGKHQNKTKTWQILCCTSASSGNLSLPMPPWLRGVFVHAKCTYSLSTLQPTRSQPLPRM